MKHLSPESTYLLDDIKNLLPKDQYDPYEKVLYWEHLLEVFTALQEGYITKINISQKKKNSKFIISNRMASQAPPMF